MPFIYSTLANDQAYTSYKPRVNEKTAPIVDRKIVIKGGARVVPHKQHSAQAVVMTSVTDDQYDFLMNHPVFKRQLAKGFLRVTERKSEDDKVVRDMTARDNSAPKEPGDYVDTDTKPAGAETSEKLKLGKKAA